MDTILYHNACPDGWCAAYIASRKYPKAKLVPLDHGLSPERVFEIIHEHIEGKEALMVDYSFPTRQQNQLADDVSKSFRILDHHKTALEKLHGLSFATFDMNRSGAGLAWDYLFGKDSTGPYGETVIDRPWWVDYTETKDLWRWNILPFDREICAYLGTLAFTKQSWDELDKLDVPFAVQLGQGALDHINHYVREVVKNAREGVLIAPKNGVLYGWRVKVLNTTYLNCSEVGNELAKTSEASLTWFERADDNIQFSLRSIGDNDVSEIAKSFFGGGHKNAAGFNLSVLAGRKLIDSILGRDVPNPVGPIHG